jgi:hypothetical protein
MSTIDARRRVLPGPGKEAQNTRALEAKELAKQAVEIARGEAQLTRLDADVARRDS